MTVQSANDGDLEQGTRSADGAPSRPQLTTWVDDRVRAEFEQRGYWNTDTWLQHVLSALAEAPHALCVADETGELTRAEVMANARRLATYLNGLGVGAGDVVTLALPNWREFVVIHTAIGLVGGVINPVLPRLGANELRHVMRTAHTRVVFAAKSHGSVSPLEVVRSAAADLDSVLEIVAVRSADEADQPSLERIVETHVEAPAEQTPGIADARTWDTVTFTSGTEALPKGVIHSHQSTMFGLRAYIGQVLRLAEDDRVFMPSPVCHASGLQWGLRTAIYAHAAMVLQDRWQPDVAIDLIDRYDCTYTLVATPFIVDLVAAHKRGAGRGLSLRYVASGGAPIPRHLVGAVRDEFGAQLMSVFGASETYVATATRPGDSDEDLASDGIPLPGIDVQVVDSEGRPVLIGLEGEITNYGPNTFLGYLGDPALTQRAFSGSRYRFGDLGRIDERGRLRVTGRIKDIVIRGGENISVREVEDLLVQHPDVEAVAVVGYPDARLGERCCAVIVASAGARPTLPVLCDYLQERGLPKFKLPERVELLSEMPMTATGKIRKADLRRWLGA